MILQREGRLQANWQTVFMLAVLQEGTEMWVVKLPVCIVPLNAEENILP